MPPSIMRCTKKNTLTIIVREKGTHKPLPGIAVHFHGQLTWEDRMLAHPLGRDETNKAGIVRFEPASSGMVEVQTDQYRGGGWLSYVHDDPTRSLLYFDLEPHPAELGVSVKGGQWFGAEGAEGAEPEYTVHVRRTDAPDEESEKVLSDAHIRDGKRHARTVRHGEFVVWLVLGRTAQSVFSLPPPVTVTLPPGGHETVEISLLPRGPNSLEISLVDEEDKPVPNEEYELHIVSALSGDTQIITGKLDDHGLAHVQHDQRIADGSYVRFPNYDRMDIAPLHEAPLVGKEKDPPEDVKEPRCVPVEVCFEDREVSRATFCSRTRSSDTSARPIIDSFKRALPFIYYRLQRCESWKPEEEEVSLTLFRDEAQPAQIWRRVLTPAEIANGEGRIDWSLDDRHWNEGGNQEQRYASLLLADKNAGRLLAELQVGKPDPGQRGDAQMAFSYIFVERMLEVCWLDPLGSLGEVWRPHGPSPTPSEPCIRLAADDVPTTDLPPLYYRFKRVSEVKEDGASIEICRQGPGAPRVWSRALTPDEIAEGEGIIRWSLRDSWWDVAEQRCAALLAPRQRQGWLVAFLKVGQVTEEDKENCKSPRQAFSRIHVERQTAAEVDP